MKTYIVIGADLDLDEVSSNNLSNFLQTKFSRYLHSLSKSSQNAARATYPFISMHDCSDNGDIDWSVSTEKIDKQLYKKYDLSNAEIKSIEAKIKSIQCKKQI